MLTQALLDSGAADIAVSAKVCEQLGVKSSPLQAPLEL